MILYVLLLFSNEKQVGEGDDVAEGQAVLLAEVVGTKQRRTLSAPEGFVAERLTLEAGEILEAGVGVLRVRVSRRDTSKEPLRSHFIGNVIRNQMKSMLSRTWKLTSRFRARLARLAKCLSSLASLLLA